MRRAIRVERPVLLGLLLGLLSPGLGCGPSQPAKTIEAGPAASSDTATETSAAGAASSSAAEAGGGAAAASGSLPKTLPTTPAAMVALGDSAAGEKLFVQEHCNGCHGTKAKPPVKFPNLFKANWSDAQIDNAFQLIKSGKSPMPAYADKLNDKQLADIVAFLKK